MERPFQRLGHVKSIAGALAVTGALVPPAAAARVIGHSGRQKLPLLWHRLVSRSLGVTSHCHGKPATGSTLYVANHLSWLDIPVLGGHLTGSFVAKAEVSDMGVVAFLANMADTIYVERERRHRTAAQAGVIEERLAAGQNVILFPEGTSNDGVRILPFKSSLFSVVEGKGAEQFQVQPVTIAYTRLNGLPLVRHRLLDIAWIGDMEFGAHAVDFMRLGRITAHILLHPPVRRADFPDRKALARHCHDVIEAGYQRLVRGHHG